MRCRLTGIFQGCAQPVGNMLNMWPYQHPGNSTLGFQGFTAPAPTLSLAHVQSTHMSPVYSFPFSSPNQHLLGLLPAVPGQSSSFGSLMGMQVQNSWRSFALTAPRSGCEEFSLSTYPTRHHLPVLSSDLSLFLVDVWSSLKPSERESNGARKRAVCTSLPHDFLY